MRVVPLTGLPLPALDRLARRIFGDRDRPAGWLARKLARECVDARLSALALADDAPIPTNISDIAHVPEDILLEYAHVPEDMLLGYMLVGREPGDPIARSAGIGLVPAARGRGCGGALLSAAAATLAAAGLTTLRVLAEPARESWYARLGLRVAARRVTLLAFGTGFNIPVPGAIRPWSPDPGALELCAWRRGAWERTPAGDAATIALPGGLAHVSREGAALLVHRLAAAPGADPCAVVTDLLARVDRGVPVLLYGCDAVSSITAALERHGLTVAQRFAEMDLALGVDLRPPRGGSP